jgi:hypothetical protein
MTGLHVVRFTDPDAPLLRCRVCKAEFYDYEQRKYRAHVVECADRHSDELDAMRLVRKPFFDPARLGTKDIEDWLDEQDAAGESNREKAKRKAKRL